MWSGHGRSATAATLADSISRKCNIGGFWHFHINHTWLPLEGATCSFFFFFFPKNTFSIWQLKKTHFRVSWSFPSDVCLSRPAAGRQRQPYGDTDACRLLCGFHVCFLSATLQPCRSDGRCQWPQASRGSFVFAGQQISLIHKKLYAHRVPVVSPNSTFCPSEPRLTSENQRWAPLTIFCLF